MMAAAVLAAGLLTGCGDKVDENKTPAQIKQEIAKWDSARIEKSIADYKKAIEAKTGEFNAALAKVKGLSPQEMLGEKGRELKAKADKIGASLEKLKGNLEAHVEALKAKATSK
ncbi:hypothetical protein SDC9_178309 [bioreactor metagenome]|uniref:Uncharacterized protein n=1 Tax=bioreactor metagenome TaxID=1076179 RepID=A0A645GVJ9_9ZZZZ